VSKPVLRPENVETTREEVLRVEDLHVSFPSPRGDIRAVNGIDFTIRAGEVLGLIGESGCGKSMTAMAIMGLLPYPGRVTRGRIFLHGENLLEKSEAELRDLRGKRVGMIFQNPMTALNPVITIGTQVGEPLVNHGLASWKQALRRALELLQLVRMPAPTTRLRAYPHELSGGMQQRAVIAMAVSCQPPLLIADEPTTALDVTIQAQILDLLREVKQSRSASLLFITHDLGVVAEMCDRVTIMYAGRVVESADVHTIFKTPMHPYTRALLNATPRIGSVERLESLGGQPPLIRGGYEGCLFAQRCALVGEDCRVEPDLLEREPGHSVRCWRVPLER
jgi:peptide/nickel transport system ATP-binding protein